jgi:hypothetical protein
MPGEEFSPPVAKSPGALAKPGSEQNFASIPNSTAPLSTTDSAPSTRPKPKGARTAGSPLAAELNAPNSDAQHDVAALHTMLRQYFRLLHGRQGRPLGNDSDLARILTGHNPMKLVILPPGHAALSADGRLRDRWGTPYFIHPRGHGAFEIRSAGPDRKLFTADDAVENPAPRQTDPAALTAIEEDTGDDG